MRVSLAAVVLVMGATAGAARADESGHPWPPTGPTWETDPGKAFERARKEEKPVFVYVATDG